MYEVEDNTEKVINNNLPVVGSMPCHNSPRRLTHMARPPTNSKKSEMKTRLLQNIYGILSPVLIMKIPTLTSLNSMNYPGCLELLKQEMKSYL